MSIESNELSAIWDKVWKESHYADHRLRIERAKNKISILLKKGLSLKPGMRVLDAGCGDGSTLFLLEKEFGIFPVGIDVSEEAIKRARFFSEKNAVSSEFKRADTRSLPFPSNYFDLILSWGVIEHFNNYDLAIDEFHRILKPQGTLNLIQPHRFSFGPIQRVLLQLLGRWESGFQIEFSGKFLKKLLTQKGFTNIEYFVTPPFPDMKSVYYTDLILHTLWKGWGHYLYLTASKYEDNVLQKTVVLIKPDAFTSNLVDHIIKMIESLHNVNILRKEVFKPTKEEVEAHHNKDLFNSLGEPLLREKIVEYWLSGPMIKILIEGKDIIDRVHDLVGNTDPKTSPNSTIRSLSKDSVERADQENRAVRNLAHAPRSEEEAKRDLSIWFKND
ncbi:MAG: methyltransferase domain-containing protein [Candidatus Brennerbacteria bacterium]|nr:methyltransferase domain-containing protein [Candidatus Brennerbacteria bacterium]